MRISSSRKLMPSKIDSKTLDQKSVKLQVVAQPKFQFPTKGRSDATTMSLLSAREMETIILILHHPLPTVIVGVTDSIVKTVALQKLTLSIYRGRDLHLTQSVTKSARLVVRRIRQSRTYNITHRSKMALPTVQSRSASTPPSPRPEEAAPTSESRHPAWIKSQRSPSISTRIDSSRLGKRLRHLNSSNRNN